VELEGGPAESSKLLVGRGKRRSMEKGVHYLTLTRNGGGKEKRGLRIRILNSELRGLGRKVGCQKKKPKKVLIARLGGGKKLSRSQ